MTLSKSRYQIKDRRIVIFGAGKIGRSFIGQLFGCGGFEVVFIDVDPVIVARLNIKGSYRVFIKGENEEEIIVQNVKAISALNIEAAADAVSKAGILAVSVGKNALENVIPVIAAGLKLRYDQSPDCPIDIIIAENMRAAGSFMKGLLMKYLPLDYPFEKLVGLVETSIGKMVPVMTLTELEKDPLMIYAESYNTLILDRNGFKSPIPDINGLAPVTNIEAWVDCKAFIHNLGHATAAYFGYYKHPEAVYLFEILDDKEVWYFTREVMIQSAVTLNIVYPDDFSISELREYIDDLLMRFRNRHLRDTIYRVGHDLVRKLCSDDRFIGAIHLAVHSGTSYDKILRAMSYGLYFKAKDEGGNLFQSDKDFLDGVSKEFESALIRNLMLDPAMDKGIIEELKIQYNRLRPDIKV